MITRLIYLSCVLLLSLMGAVQAVSTWTGAVNNAYETAGNWTPAAPTAADQVNLTDILPGPTVTGITGVGFNVVITNSALTIDSGNLTLGSSIDIAGVAGSTGTMTMNGGSVTVGKYLGPGYRGTGTINMNGGVINCLSTFRVAHYATSVGYVNLRGGDIICPSFSMRDQAGAIATMVLGDGTMRVGRLIVNGDKTALLQGYINNGWIIPYNRNHKISLDYNVTIPGKTTLKAPRLLLDPRPYDTSNVSHDYNLLQWTRPDPNDPNKPSIVSVDVYFGTEPNALIGNPKIVNKQPIDQVAVTLESQKTYYWHIDVYDSSMHPNTVPYYHSPIFTFNTMNTPPVVEAGDTVVTYLPGGPRVVQLNGSVSDPDGGPGPATILWTVVTEPAPLNPAVFSNPNIVNPTVTLSAAGTYTLQLAGGDGEYTTTDTMTIIVYADACDHASHQPGFTWFTYDGNQDCKVDLLDFVGMAAEWLEHNYTE